MTPKEIVENTVNGLTDFEKTCFDYFNFNYEDMKTNLEDNANFVDFYDITDEIPARQLRGVFSSLEKKELIFYADCDEGTYYISSLAVACWFFINERETFDKEVDILGKYI